MKKIYVYVLLTLSLFNCKRAQYGYFQQQSGLPIVGLSPQTSSLFSPSTLLTPLSSTTFLPSVSLSSPLSSVGRLTKATTTTTAMTTAATTTTKNTFSAQILHKTTIQFKDETPLKVEKKVKNKAIRGYRIALVFVVFSILAMIYFAGAASTLPLAFGVLTLGLAIFFGSKAIREVKNKQKKS